MSAHWLHGSEAQQRKTAHRILEEGDKLAIGITEPDANTDLFPVKTTAVEKDRDYVINGTNTRTH